MKEQTSDMTNGLQFHEEASDIQASKPIESMLSASGGNVVMNAIPGEEEEMQLVRKITAGKGKPLNYWD